MEIIKLIPTGKDYLWGGTRLREEYGKKIDLTPLAETWECSVHPDGPSYIANGGGLAYGLDRWVSIFAGLDSIRDCIAFPKNNSGRDVMLDAPSVIDQKQLDELNLIVEVKE